MDTVINFVNEGRVCLQQTLWCNLSLSRRSQRINALSEDFGMAAQTRNGNHGNPLNFNYINKLSYRRETALQGALYFRQK